MEDLRRALGAQLTPLYDAGEAMSIARIAADYARRFVAPNALNDFWAQLSQRLLAGEPIQYVLGETEFLGKRFKVSPAVLIPRMETEELVVLAWDILKEKKAPAVLDIGLGSGCIALSIKAKRPDTRLFGLEKSPEALEIARENITWVLKNPDAVHFAEGDILQPETLPSDWPLFDLIVSNPPYIPHQEAALMPAHVLAHEPHLALFVEDADPLLFYRKIAEWAKTRLAPGGHLLFECNEFNAREVVQLLEQQGYKHTTLHKDLSGADRTVISEQ
ncbi:MAG: peptide chain release factor N(5)-glutamine methyltransferase [Chitinophagales bacterium]|nr:peptide chain release factor N(5)-glutamine methyltransferase [Chitinophagales bacterium]